MAGEGQWHAWLRRGAEPRLTEWSTGPVKRATDIICRPYTSDNEGPSDLQESRIHNDLHGFRTLSMATTLWDESVLWDAVRVVVVRAVSGHPLGMASLPRCLAVCRFKFYTIYSGPVYLMTSCSLPAGRDSHFSL